MNLPYSLIDGDFVEIYNVRNFTYQSETDYQPLYETRRYDLRKLDSVWFVVERFGDLPGIAHTFLSFGFGDDYVSVSVEVRKEKGETYSVLMGLLREYEIMYVIGDERDLIGLRTNVRRDQVYLYPIVTTRDRIRQTFLDILKRTKRLHQTPEFYNTVTNTCTTNIVRHVNTISPQRVPYDPRILLPAYSDKLAYELGLIDTSLPFEQTQAAHRIDLIAQQHSLDRNFSKAIRAGRSPGG